MSIKPNYLDRMAQAGCNEPVAPALTAAALLNTLNAAEPNEKKALQAALLDLLKGEEVQDFKGNTLGYLLPTTQKETV